MSTITVPVASTDRDPIDRLPEAARNKVLALRDRRDQAHALLRAQDAQVEKAREQHDRAEQALRAWEEAYKAGRLMRHTTVAANDPNVPYAHRGSEHERREVVETTRIEPDDERLEAERQKVARLRAELDRRRAVYDRLAAEWRPLAALATRLEEWIGNLPYGVALLPDDGGSVKRPKGNVADAIEQVREQRHAILAELRDIRDAPRPAAEIKADLERQIDDLARAGRPDVRSLMAGNGAVRWPTDRAEVNVVTPEGHTGTGRAVVRDALAVVAFIAREQLLEAVADLVDEQAEDDVALDRDERARRAAELRCRCLEVERVECGYLDLAHDDGRHIAPRPDTDPRAYLALASDLPGLKE